MSQEFDLVGATGDGLGTRYIVLRVKKIDIEKLKNSVGGSAGAAIPLALPLVDRMPEEALKMALPYVVKKASEGYGVDLEWQVTNAPPQKGVTPPDKLGIGVAVGASGVGVGWVIWHFGLRHLL